MQREKTYYVYIMSSQRRVLYTGITGSLLRRVLQHKQHAFEGFTSHYNVTNLVYFERSSSFLAAIAREKEIKSWRREKKIALVNGSNQLERSEQRLVSKTSLRAG